MFLLNGILLLILRYSFVSYIQPDSLKQHSIATFHTMLMVGPILLGIYWVQFTDSRTRWRSWLRHYATSRKVAGSIPDGVIGIFSLT